MEHADRSNIEDFRHQVFNVVECPKLPTWSQYERMDEGSRLRLNEERIAYMVAGLRIQLPVMDEVNLATQQLILRNRNSTGSREGIILDAPPLAGKSETAMSAARRMYRRYAKAHPEYLENGEVPCLWLNVPASTTGKGLVEEIAHSLSGGIRPPRTWNTSQVLDAALDMLDSHRVQLLVLDEVQNIAPRAGMGSSGEASDVLKAIQNRSRVTLLMAGAHLDQTGIFKQVRAQQVSERCQWFTLEPATKQSAESRAAWADLVNTFEVKAPLIGNKPGILAANSDTLLDACSGSVGKLSRFVLQVAQNLIDDETRTKPEQITSGILDREVTRWLLRNPTVAQQATPARKRRSPRRVVA